MRALAWTGWAAAVLVLKQTVDFERFETTGPASQGHDSNDRKPRSGRNFCVHALNVIVVWAPTCGKLPRGPEHAWFVRICTIWD
ncbi:MAG: hypothetical protein RLZZ157_1837 [Pseudomonadota bacterium]|jgi:hypothetical protein